MTGKETPKTSQEKDKNWMDDINIESVEKVAKLDIKPSLVFGTPSETMSIKHRVIIISLPEIVVFADGNKYFCMNIIHDGIQKQLVAEAKSLRFSLAVLIKKFGVETILDTEVLIEKYLGNTKERKNVPLYKITPI